jgi:hypothetical protein
MAVRPRRCAAPRPSLASAWSGLLQTGRDGDGVVAFADLLVAECVRLVLVDEEPLDQILARRTLGNMDVPTTLVSAGLGVVGGAISALVAPWAKWGVERRRRIEDRRVGLIEGWRAGIRQLRNAENNSLTRDAENAARQIPEEPDLPEADPRHPNHEWFRSLEPELSPEAVDRIEQLRQLPIRERTGQIPDLLEEQVMVIERTKWKLL